MPIKEERQKKEALEISIKEGCAANAMMGFGDQYVTPAMLAVGGTAGHVGFLSAITGIMGPLAQLWGNKLEKKYPNKKIVLNFVFLQVIGWMLLGAVLIIPALMINKIPLYSIMTLYILGGILGGLLHPAFFSWMGSLVKKQERGKYFSKRGVIIGIVGMISILLGAVILDYFKDISKVIYGFALLFILAAIFRAISFMYLKRQYDPPKGKIKIIELPWKKFFSVKDKMGQFTIGMAAFNFALMIASPFFSVYLLQERQYSYLIYTILIMGSAAWSLIFLPLIGKFSDRYGNASLLSLAGFLFAITPPMWIIFQNPILILLIPQLLNGIANAALNIGLTNYIYANTPTQTRGTTVAHVNVLGGFGTVVGSILGGLLLTSFRTVPNIFFIVFLIAMIFRGAVSLLFLSKLKDVRSSHSKTLNFDLIHPLKTIHHDTRMIKNLIEK
ncbi:MAG TPA: MFS transporter [Candidatus Nanoarchaeia archaeon]|nr:MFS transporter [Candidatus Nanoarchaeia archaeon]